MGQRGLCGRRKLDGIVMGAERQAGGPVSESTYELPPYCDAVEAVLKHKRESVQETLTQLAANGFYIVRRRDGKK